MLCKIYILLVITLIVNCVEPIAVPVPNSGNSTNSTKSTNERIARNHEFPFMVSLRYAMSIENTEYHIHVCGGAVYNARTLITAASCLYKNNSYYISYNFYAIAGSNHYYTTERTAQQKRVASVFIHKKYRLFDLNADIALVRFFREFHLDGNMVDSIELATEEFPVGTRCSLLGWGSSLTNVTNDLRVVDVIITNKIACSKIYWDKARYMVQSGQICGMSKGNTICKADLGGPLVCNKTLYGVASVLFTRCNIEGLPVLYTNVFQERRFIQSCAASQNMMKFLLNILICIKAILSKYY